jgi:sporulation protein YlmC with PRC-barrel domain
VIRASDLSGLAVYNPKDERLGKIEDLVLDPASGKIRYAVLSFGGVLGIGDKYFALPWKCVSFVAKGQTSAGTQKESHCVLDVDKDFLKNAPGFDKDHWPDFADATWRQKVDEYYRARAAAHGQTETR